MSGAAAAACTRSEGGEREEPPHRALDESSKRGGGSSYVRTAEVGCWCTCVGANSQSPSWCRKKKALSSGGIPES